MDSRNRSALEKRPRLRSVLPVRVESGGCIEGTFEFEPVRDDPQLMLQAGG